VAEAVGFLYGMSVRQCQTLTDERRGS